MKYKNNSVLIDLLSTIFAQSAALLIPMLMMPLLSKNIGSNGAGLIILSISTFQFLIVFTDYGFGISMIKRLASVSDASHRYNKLISAVISIKIALVIISAIPYVAYVYYLNNGEKYFWLFFWMFLSASVFAFQCNWYFQIRGKQTPINIATACTGIGFLICTILVINKPEDIWVAGFVHFLASASMILVGYKYFRFKYSLPKLKRLIFEFKYSFEYFLSRIAAASYTITGGIFLSVFSTPEELTKYLFAEIIYKVGVAVVYPISQVFYPYFANNKIKDKHKKLMMVVALIAALGAILVALNANILSNFLVHEKIIGFETLIQLFGLAAALSICSIILGYPFLVIVNRMDLANKSVIFAACTQIVAISFLVLFDFVSAINVCLMVVLIELFVFLFRIYFYIKLK